MKMNKIFALLAFLMSISMFGLLMPESFLVIKSFHPFVAKTRLSGMDILSFINAKNEIIIFFVATSIVCFVNIFVSRKALAIVNLALIGIVGTLTIIAFSAYISAYTFNYYGFAGVLYIISLLANIVLNIILLRTIKRTMRKPNTTFPTS